jgi:hypothetical protein
VPRSWARPDNQWIEPGGVGGRLEEHPWVMGSGNRGRSDSCQRRPNRAKRWPMVLGAGRGGGRARVAATNHIQWPGWVASVVEAARPGCTRQCVGDRRWHTGKAVAASRVGGGGSVSEWA